MTRKSHSKKTYIKADSLLELRQKRNDGSEEIAFRLRRLGEGIDNLSLPLYQKQIIRRACEDLLDSTDAKPRERFSLREHVTEEIHRLNEDELPRYLFYRYRYDMFPQSHVLDEYPPCLQIEPTSICNYRCVFCYQIDATLTNPKNGHMGVMSLDLFKKVVDQAEGSCEAVTLASRGEPLLCRDIVEMIRYAGGKFLAFKINTNASHLDEEKAHAILSADVNTLVFSADAAVEPLYSQLRVRGNLDRVVANVRMFKSIQERHYPKSRLITRVSGVRYTDAQNLDDMEKFWGDMVDQVVFVDYNPWENVYDQPSNDIAAPCSDLWRRMFIWFDGRVNPCDVDFRSTLGVGNVKEQTLAEIWHGERYDALRKQHLDAKRNALSPCRACSVI